jgi:hypothetical protein
MQALGQRVGSQRAISGVVRSDAVVRFRQSAVAGSKKHVALRLREKRLPAPQRVVLRRELARVLALPTGIGRRPELAGIGIEER